MRIINENPVELADPLLCGTAEKERVPYTREQIRQILDTVPMDSPYRIILILGIFCGMRIQIIKKPKSKKSIRVLCFGEAVQTELKQLKEREEKERQLLGSEYLKPQTELLTIQQKKVEF